MRSSSATTTRPILAGDFVGMGEAAFVPMADVPDFYWKPRMAKQGFARPFEGPNHFADMDQPDGDGKTLLALCEDPAIIDPATGTRSTIS